MDREPSIPRRTRRKGREVRAANAGASANAGGGAAGSGAGKGAGGSAAPALEPFVPAPAALRRLSAEQYQSSVRILLGDVDLTVELEPDTSLNGFVAIGQARATISPAAMEKYENAAYELAAQAVAPDRREKFVGCTPKGVTDADLHARVPDPLRAPRVPQAAHR